MENNNSVCYVGLIGEIIPIEGADNIELALVGGWQAITKKGEYEVGNKVVIATTDAVIPVELSDLMGVTGYLRKGQRVRTVKLRGVYSECLLIPFKYLSPTSYSPFLVIACHPLTIASSMLSAPSIGRISPITPT